MTETLSYLIMSVSLSSGRNIASKKTAADTNKKSQFFLSQSILFASAALLLFGFGVSNLATVSAVTIVYGIVYGVLLVLSQWMFTLALQNGNTALCTVIYSLGFLLPTVSGALFWNEDFTILHLIGVLVAVAVILLSAKKEKKESESEKSFIPFILIAMVSSGGLGIMQKIQQSGPAAEEKGTFLLIAFAFAFCSSLVAVFMFCREKAVFDIKNALYPSVAGICFGGANFCNTVLAGKMKSAIFFPVQNVSTILLSTMLGIVLFKEKITPKTTVILILGLTVIVLFSV